MAPAKKTAPKKTAPKKAAAKPVGVAKSTVTESGHKAAMTKKDERIAELEEILRQVGFGHKVNPGQ